MSARESTVTHNGANSKEAFTTFEVVKGEKRRVSGPAYVDDGAIQLSENSLKVLERRYLRRDINGELLETAAGMFYRIASHIAAVERSTAATWRGRRRSSTIF